MSDGQYNLIRFIPDPARGEPLNIGIVMQSEGSTPLISFPDDALERAARWSTFIDRAGLVSLQQELTESLSRHVAMRDDIGLEWDPRVLGEMMGVVTVSEPRWIETPRGEAGSAAVFDYLVGRLVQPPKQVVYGGGAAPARKLANDIFPSIRQFRPDVSRDEQLVGHSGLPFVADIYSGGEAPLLVSTLVLTSSWQSIRAVEARAFQLFDVQRALSGARIAACCRFPEIDPEGVTEVAQRAFASIDTKVVTPQSVQELEALA